MNKKYLYIGGGVILALLLLRSCGRDRDVVVNSPVPVAQEPMVVQSPVAAPVAPVVVQNSDSGFFHGMLMGHLLGGGGGYHSSHTTRVVHHYQNTPRRSTFNSAPKYYGPRASRYSSPYKSARPSISYRSRTTTRSVRRR